MTEFNFDTSYYFSSLYNLISECTNYTDSEIKYKELIDKLENEIYQKGYKQGLKEAFNKLECEEFDTCLRIEYEKSKAYEKALDDFVNKFVIDFSESVIWSNALECAKYLNIDECTNKNIDYTYDTVRKVAEQLKKGAEE